MARLQFPTQAPPQGEVRLVGGTFNIAPGNRVRLENPMGLHTPGSLWLEPKATDVEIDEGEVQVWALFHDFLLADGMACRHHDSGRLDYSISDMAEASPNAVDYADILPRAYFINVNDPSTLPKRGYAELYEMFSRLDGKDIGRVKNCLISLGKRSFSTRSPIFDYSYWQLVPSYSVIEALVGQPPMCGGSPACPECRRSVGSHHSIGATEWWRTRMEALVPDTLVRATYTSQLDVARTRIRHGTVHASLHPTAQHVDYESGTHVYDFERATREYRHDRAALSALSINVRDIARWLLMNDIFGLQVFPVLKPLNVAVLG